MLLIDDISGVKTKATLARGEKPGTTDLLVDVMDTKKIDGSLTTDNYGNWFTGKNRGGLNLNINNPGGGGDQIILSEIYAGSGMDNHNLAYQIPVAVKAANWESVMREHITCWQRLCNIRR